MHNKGSKIDCTIQTKDDSWEDTSDPSYFSVHKKRPIKDDSLEDTSDPSYFSVHKKRPIKQHAKQAWKCNGHSSSDGDDIWITDEGPKVDWVKITVHKTVSLV